MKTQWEKYRDVPAQELEMRNLRNHECDGESGEQADRECARTPIWSRAQQRHSATVTAAIDTDQQPWPVADKGMNMRILPQFITRRPEASKPTELIKRKREIRDPGIGSFHVYTKS